MLCLYLLMSDIQDNKGQPLEFVITESFFSVCMLNVLYNLCFYGCLQPIFLLPVAAHHQKV